MAVTTGRNEGPRPRFLGSGTLVEPDRGRVFLTLRTRPSC